MYTVSVLRDPDFVGDFQVIFRDVSGDTMDERQRIARDLREVADRLENPEWKPRATS